MTLVAAMTRADYALLIALGSLAASLLALGFQLWSALRLDRATIKVTVGTWGVVQAGTPAIGLVLVTAVNQGKRPTKLTSLWLNFSNGRWMHRKFIPKRWRRNVALMMLAPIPGLHQPELPQVLDVGGEVSVYYLSEMVKKRLDEGSWTHCFATAGASTASGVSKTARTAKILK